MLKSNQKAPYQSANLALLRAESFSALIALTGLIAYVWLIMCIWPITGGHAITAPWVGSGVLLVGVGLSYVLRHRQPPLAYPLFVWSAWVACASLVFALPSPAFACLFILPVIFASVLLGRRSIVTTAGLAILFLAAMSRIRPDFTTDAIEQALPMTVIGLVAAVAWLTSRNLYVALAWAWDGYERASRNEQVARDQQAELRRVLKALDEASYRLERAGVALALARDQAEESRRLKQAFAQNISHELRTPLSLIVGFADLMIKSPDYYGGRLPPPYLRDLGVLHRNASHLQELLNDVLDLARIEAAHMSLAIEKVNPAAFLHETANTVRSLVESRGLELRVEAEPDLPALWMDPTRIRQVLINLISNAVRFTERGGITMRVFRRNPEQAEEEVVFVVEDSGAGIAPENVQRVFDEFFHTHSATEHGHTGAGLGLTISRNFVQLHGGRIWLESELGRGSAFSFSLPTVQQKAYASAPSVESFAASLPMSVQSIVLIVTRSPGAATMFTRYMQGCRTIIVQSLQQAEHAARQLLPQCVVIDSALLDTPELKCESKSDPALALQRLAQAWNVAQTPLVACPMSGDALEGLGSERVNGYIPKPVTGDCLLDVLRQYGEGIDRILIIDDDADFVRLLGRMLEACSVRRYELMTAGDGCEGFEMIQHFQPDLVLLDLGLPDVDGFQLIERIRSSWPALPIVVVSGQEAMDRLKTLDGGMTIAKATGITAGELVHWVQQVVDAATSRSASAAQKAMFPL